jgi:hypothetical protein
MAYLDQEKMIAILQITTVIPVGENLVEIVILVIGRLLPVNRLANSKVVFLKQRPERN